MKHLVSFLTIILFTACTSPHHLVNQGNHEKAMKKAIKKYSKNRKLNTKNVRALEHAFRYVNAKDVKKVQRMALESHVTWYDIYFILEGVHNRQTFIERYTPIKSKEGYFAKFDFVSLGRIQENLFKQAQQRDMNEIKRLKQRNDPSCFTKIYKLYSRIDLRQQATQNKLPLVSNDGYRPKFDFEEVGRKLSQAKTGSFNFELGQVMDLIKQARKGSKYFAREAAKKLHAIKKYKMQTGKIQELISEANYLGTTRVLVKLENKSSSLIPREVKDAVLQIHTKDIKRPWTEFYTKREGRNDFDYISLVTIDELKVSPAQEDVHHYADEKEVADGWQYVLDKKGNVLKDSLGNDIKVEKFKKIYANLHDVKRCKKAFVRGKVIFRKPNGARVFSTEPVNVSAVFQNSFATYDGNKNALSNESKNKLNQMEVPFPSDHALVMDAVTELKIELRRILQRVKL